MPKHCRGQRDITENKGKSNHAKSLTYPKDRDTADLRYFFDNPNDFKERTLNMASVEKLIDKAEKRYYVHQVLADLVGTGKALYHWLDGEDRFLTEPITACRGTDTLALAISTEGKLAHLPWEVLHDGNVFLAQRKNPVIVPVRWQDQNTGPGEPVNRPLQVLFMACSPTDVKPLLDFEDEEARILRATKNHPMSLAVEESGCLDELRDLMDYYEPGYFDVFHLSGHANITDDGPRFFTESDMGKVSPASAEDIMEALPHTPRVIFLSGCRTGEADRQGGVPSLAEEFLELGANAVLGWGRSVLDTEASYAAAELYGALSKGYEMARALGETWQSLIKKDARDWHLLRLYVAGDVPAPLVTPLKTKGRAKVPRASLATRLFGKDTVPTRENFIGRRRPLQRCLRAIRENDEDRAGVLIHGMGGLGKTSLASRVCDRLMSDFTPVIWVGKVDEFRIINELCKKLDKSAREQLLDPDEELRYKLRDLFDEQDTPFLLVLDDFEANFEKEKGSFDLIFRDGLPVLSPEAKKVTEALVFAIQESDSPDRVIITSRYTLNIEEADCFYAEHLGRLGDADVQKKLKRLEGEKKSPLKGEIYERLRPGAEKVADGNPRLLEWLCEIMGEKGLDMEKILERMAKKETEFRESILAEELLRQQQSELREMLARVLVYELPVPYDAVEAVCEDVSDLDEQIERAGGYWKSHGPPPSLILRRMRKMPIVCRVSWSRCCRGRCRKMGRDWQGGLFRLCIGFGGRKRRHQARNSALRFIGWLWPGERGRLRLR